MKTPKIQVTPGAVVIDDVHFIVNYQNAKVLYIDLRSKYPGPVQWRTTVEDEHRTLTVTIPVRRSYDETSEWAYETLHMDESKIGPFEDQWWDTALDTVVTVRLPNRYWHVERHVSEGEAEAELFGGTFHTQGKYHVTLFLYRHTCRERSWRTFGQWVRGLFYRNPSWHRNLDMPQWVPTDEIINPE